MSEGLLETFHRYMDAGGFVMMPLVVATLVLWYFIGYRLLTLQRGTTRHVRTLIRDVRTGRPDITLGLIDRAATRGVRVADAHPSDVAKVLDEHLFPFYQDVKRGRNVIMAIVGIAPLIGLLGTVSGMIETFESLGDMSLFSQSGGISGGISEALFSTQMGLCVAVPGVIVGRLLDRRQRRFEEELDQIKALLGGAL
jgi:biopolymer transport protein ExbB